jgi:hypothetical protein
MNPDRYSIILPNEKAKTYDYVTLFILLMNLLVFGFIYFNSIEMHIKNLSLWGTVVCLFSFAILLIHRFTKYRYPFRIEIIFIVLALLWFLTDRYLLALSIVCFAVMGTYTRRKFEVIFSTEGVVYPSFPKKTFLWADVSNVILKDGMLTIDLKNNKLIQTVIDKESELAINEREFNLFCKKQINSDLVI